MGSVQQAMLGYAAAGASLTTPEVEFDGRSLPGSDGDLTTWTDSSGNGRDATGGASAQQTVNGVLNGHAVSRWTGSVGQKLDFTGNAVTDVFTVIAVVKCTDGGTRSILAEGTGGDGPPRFHINANKIELVEDDNVTIGTSSTSLSTSSFYTVAVTWDTSSNAWVFYLNGSADGSGTTSDDFTRRFSRIGCRSGNQNVFKGDIAYVAYWSSVLSSGELTTRFNDLRTVWGHY